MPLATASLQNFRKRRYRGDNVCLPLPAFAEVDRRYLRTIYQFLEELFARLQPNHGNPIRSLDIDREQIDAMVERVQALGQKSLQTSPSELMAKTLHDLRGGAMNALLGRLQLAGLQAPSELGRRQLFFLVRDNLKIMRNALLGLDDLKREADLLPKMHSIDLIVEKWQDALIPSGDRSTQLQVSCDFHGNIAECCVELGALDRVLYNLVNNACRHTSSGEVKLSIHGLTDEEDQPADLRFEVRNPVGRADRQRLCDRGDLRTLFQPGVSSTGSGLGLTVVLDFVLNAYGLGGRSQALEGDYLGAHLTPEDDFVVWFHWPVAEDV